MAVTNTENLDCIETIGVDDTSACAELADGTIIAEQYKVLSKLGSGGMSHVYRCQDLQLNRVVAIKLLDQFTNAVAIARFQREAQIVSMLEQDNIVKLHGLHLTGAKQPFIVMELVDGQSLAEIIDKSGPLPLARVMKFIGQICDALTVAHANGVIHRDLKPSNIMVVNCGREGEKLKLLDFGIAKVTNDPSLKTTRTGEVFGSPAYMSPEQAQGRTVDEKTDQYSLGCLIFELLTGRTPFRSENILSMMLAHVQETAPLISSVSKRKFPLPIDHAVARLLEKNPGDRYASITEAKKALLCDAPVNNSGTTQLLKRAFFHPFSRAAIAAILLSSLALFAFLHFPKPDGETRSDVKEKVSVSTALTTDEILLLNRLQLDPMAETLDLSRKRLTDAGMRAFAGVQFVRQLNLAGDEITDVGLKYLVGLDLVRLGLKQTKLTDMGMSTICQMPALESLDLSQTDISDSGCASLKCLKHLKELDLSRTFISGAALSNLAKLQNLQELQLSGNNVADNLAPLTKLDLRALSLSETQLRDDNMTTLAQIQTLLQLDIARNKDVTDAGLLELAKLRNLRVLDARDCSITAAGVREFKRLLPHCCVNLHGETSSRDSGGKLLLRALLKEAAAEAIL